jgi:hypothetical protein
MLEERLLALEAKIREIEEKLRTPKPKEDKPDGPKED